MQQLVARRTVFGAAALCALASAFPAATHAFSDPLAYTEPAELGGGGGRWFTGSSADGYGCEVCHQAGAPVDLTITGLPVDGFEPGSAYEVTVSWPLGTEHLALIAELMDEERATAGSIALPRPDAYRPVELCSGDLLGFPSSNVHVTEVGRQLVSVIDCGAQILRFQWTAPVIATGPVWFNLGFVAGDGDAAPGGDGVTMVRQPLTVAGSSSEARTIAQGSCSASGPLGRSVQGEGVLLWTAALLVGTRLRARARTGGA